MEKNRLIWIWLLLAVTFSVRAQVQPAYQVFQTNAVNTPQFRWSTPLAYGLDGVVLEKVYGRDSWPLSELTHRLSAGPDYPLVLNQYFQGEYEAVARNQQGTVAGTTIFDGVQYATTIHFNSDGKMVEVRYCRPHTKALAINERGDVFIRDSILPEDNQNVFIWQPNDKIYQWYVENQMGRYIINDQNVLVFAHLPEQSLGIPGTGTGFTDYLGIQDQTRSWGMELGGLDSSGKSVGWVSTETFLRLPQTFAVYCESKCSELPGVNNEVTATQANCTLQGTVGGSMIVGGSRAACIWPTRYSQPIDLNQLIGGPYLTEVDFLGKNRELVTQGLMDSGLQTLILVPTPATFPVATEVSNGFDQKNSRLINSQVSPQNEPIPPFLLTVPYRNSSGKAAENVEIKLRLLSHFYYDAQLYGYRVEMTITANGVRSARDWVEGIGGDYHRTFIIDSLARNLATGIRYPVEKKPDGSLVIKLGSVTANSDVNLRLNARFH